MSLKTQFSFNQRVDIEHNQALATDFLSLIERPGMDSLIDYLFESDYFTAPASTRYHIVFPGGLCFHSLNVTREFSKENTNWQKPIPQDSVIICGLLHDPVSYTHLRAHETVLDLVCRLLLEKKK